MCSRVHFVMPRDQEPYRQSCEREEALKAALRVTDDAQYKRFLTSIPVDVLRKIVVESTTQDCGRVEKG